MADPVKKWLEFQQSRARSAYEWQLPPKDGALRAVVNPTIFVQAKENALKEVELRKEGK